MTKNELLDTAKELNIKGRHDMTKEQLAAAVAEAKAKIEAATVAELETATDAKAHKSGRVLVKRTNLPWRRKYYYLDEEVYTETAEARNKAPMQVQLILKYMFENKINDAEVSEQGGDICGGAINSGYVKTKIEAPILFAYYRKDMEQLGLAFAGYDTSR